MSGFLDPLKVELVNDGAIWRTLEKMDYDIGEIGSGIKICVPQGTLTDFGSVPQILWSLISPIGPATRAYVLHDFLYHKQALSRGMSDYILLEALEVLGLPLWHRRAVYTGVRLGGWLAWAKHRKAAERSG